MRVWPSGMAFPSQGKGREFESRHPLQAINIHNVDGN